MRMPRGTTRNRSLPRRTSKNMSLFGRAFRFKCNFRRSMGEATVLRLKLAVRDLDYRRRKRAAGFAMQHWLLATYGRILAVAWVAIASVLPMVVHCHSEGETPHALLSRSAH